jgi:acyl-CoA synthetase (AMP-forming)/AMP-acid ligase II
MLLHDLLRASAQRYPDRTAVVFQGRATSYAELELQSDIVALRLRERGVAAGDRVALAAPNSAAYVAAYFGILKAGGVIVPVNVLLTEREIAAQLADCGPAAVLAAPALREMCRRATGALVPPPAVIDVDAALFAPVSAAPAAPVPRADDDLAALIYTSGTTGRPKGVMLSHRNLCANAESIVRYLGLTCDDSVMVVLPFYYSYGNSLLTTHIRAGGALVIDNRFLYPNAVLETMAARGVTGFAGVPSHYAILLRKSALAAARLPRLRYVTQAGGAMAPALINEFRALLPQVRFFVMYGQTEASARLSYLEPEQLARKAGSIGTAIPGVELEIFTDDGRPAAPGEVGEIAARGANVMQGYWNAPAATREVLRDGWLYTGDLARRDEEGFIFIVSRKKDMIKSGANRINPAEIEDVVAGMAGVAECAAVGVGDEILGEAIMLYVVPAAGAALTARDVHVFCRTQLAFFKVPKYVEFIAALPRTASGKVRRGDLREQAAAALQAPAYAPMGA